MSKVIDSFLVALGFELDPNSEKEANNAIDGVRTNALEMGAALAASFAGMGAVVSRTARDINDLGNDTRLIGTIGIESLSKYQHAFRQAGGSIEDATATLMSFEDMLAKAAMGEGPFEELEKAGISSDLLQNTRTATELFQRLSDIYPTLTDRQQRLADSALGLNRGASLLLREGPEALSKYIGDAEKFGSRTSEMAENSRELTQELNNLSRAWGHLFDLFTSDAAEGMSGWVAKLAEIASSDAARNAASDSALVSGAVGSGAVVGAAAAKGGWAAGSGVLSKSLGAAGKGGLAGLAGAASFGAGYFVGGRYVNPMLDNYFESQYGAGNFGGYLHEVSINKNYGSPYSGFRGQRDRMIQQRIDRININVNGAKSPQDTAQEVNRKLKDALDAEAEARRSSIAG